MTNSRPDLYWFETVSGIYLKTKKITEESLKPHDLTWPQYGALMAMSGHEPLSQRELANAMEVDTTNAMVICDSLEKKGLIERRRDPSDRRINRLHMTDEGKTRFNASSSSVMAGYTSITREVSADELASITPVLSKLYSVISGIYAQLGKEEVRS